MKPVGAGSDAIGIANRRLGPCRKPRLPAWLGDSEGFQQRLRFLSLTEFFFRVEQPLQFAASLSLLAGFGQRRCQVVANLGVVWRLYSRLAQQFHAAVARADGAEILHEPRLWPEYHPGYYGAFFRDPDGNNVEAVFHGAAPAN